METPPLSDALGKWTARFEKALAAALLKRLGLAPREPEADRALAAALVGALQSRVTKVDRVFFDWRGGRDPGEGRYPQEPFRALAAALQGRETPTTHAYWSDAHPCSMHIEEVEAIWSAIAEGDDWAPFNAKVAAIRRMGEAMETDAPA